MWTHLERQKGGIGLRGPGETQLEMDRRRIQQLIRTLKRDLELVRTRRAQQRAGRRRHGWGLVSLVGYTNAGKSTLLNRLSGASIYAQDQLFATLDPTTRQVDLPQLEPLLMTDTVGFIQEVPTHLVDSFKATLEEVVEADLLLHVIDSTHPQVELQMDAVHQVLDEIGSMNTPMVYLFNKIDDPRGARAAKRQRVAIRTRRFFRLKRERGWRVYIRSWRSCSGAYPRNAPLFAALEKGVTLPKLESMGLSYLKIMKKGWRACMCATWLLHGLHSLKNMKKNSLEKEVNESLQRAVRFVWCAPNCKENIGRNEGVPKGGCSKQSGNSKRI